MFIAILTFLVCLRVDVWCFDSARPSNASIESNQGQRYQGKDPCQCVPRHFCKSATIISNGSKTFDSDSWIWYDFPGVCYCNTKYHKCDDYVEVCCVPPDKAITPLGYFAHSERKRIGCGQINTGSVFSWFDDDDNYESLFGEFPWMTGILANKESGIENPKVFRCGGALIHERVVLTAAHCFYGQENTTFVARVGEWDLQTKKEIYKHQDQIIELIIIHEKFDSTTLLNDIALLFTKKPFILGDNVDTVCLPNQGRDATSDKCFLSGWGQIDFGPVVKYPILMKKLPQVMVDRKSCQSQLQATSLGPNVTLPKSIVCAKSPKKYQSCKGDGGSPLVCPIPGREFLYELVGVAAWGIECQKDTPAVFTNVAAFRDWIEYNVNVNQLAAETEDAQILLNVTKFKYR